MFMLFIRNTFILNTVIAMEIICQSRMDPHGLCMLKAIFFAVNCTDIYSSL